MLTHIHIHKHIKIINIQRTTKKKLKKMQETEPQIYAPDKKQQGFQNCLEFDHLLQNIIHGLIKRQNLVNSQSSNVS